MVPGNARSCGSGMAAGMGSGMGWDCARADGTRLVNVASATKVRMEGMDMVRQEIYNVKRNNDIDRSQQEF